MIVPPRVRSSGPQHTAAARRLAGARDRQRRLLARIGQGRPTAEDQVSLSVGRASVASCAAWLHWVERSESPEPWADGEWAPRSAVATGSWMALAQPERVSELRGKITTFAWARGLNDTLVADVELATSEALTNVVMHAYRDCDAPGPMTLRVGLDRTAEVLEVGVADSGSGMVPRPDSPGAGLGLSIMVGVADRLDVGPGADGHGTEVSLSFTLR